MEKKLKIVALAFVTLAFLVGCLNMPTPSSQITGSYTSGIKYEGLDCRRLAVELDSLTKERERIGICSGAKN